jgi:hypothetical protein
MGNTFIDAFLISALISLYTTCISLPCAGSSGLSRVRQMHDILIFNGNLPFVRNGPAGGSVRKDVFGEVDNLCKAELSSGAVSVKRNGVPAVSRCVT